MVAWGNLQSDDIRQGETKQTPVCWAADGKRWCLWGSVCNFGAIGMESYNYSLNWAEPPPKRRSGTSSRAKRSIFLRWHREAEKQEGLTWSGSWASLNPPSIWLCLPSGPNKYHKTKDPTGYANPAMCFQMLVETKKCHTIIEVTNLHWFTKYCFLIIILFSSERFFIK